MKKLFLLAGLLTAGLSASAQLSDVTDIDDLALIYIGSQHRPEWGKEQFKPYVMHTYPNGTSSWMFDGFLMIEFQAYNENGSIVSFGESNGLGAQKPDWERLIKVQLGIETGQGCKALDDLIGELIPKLGKPGHKHKVVLTLPIAEAKSGITWGSINGQKLNFQYQSDREEAMKWYIDYAIDLWNKAGFKNIELDGVYWTKEAFTQDYRAFLRNMNNYYKSRKLHTYWIPYLNAKGYDCWADYGIEVAYQQPNYYFDTDYPHRRLEQAVERSWNYNMGLEMEFEGYNYAWSAGMDKAQRYTPGNIGLYGLNPKYYQRLVDYIDYFEETEVFDFKPIAYYSGFQGVYDFEKSGHPKDKEVMDRLALLINKRHRISHWDKEPSAGIGEAVISDIRIAYGLEGAIYIDDSAEGDIAVYGIDGRLVYDNVATVESTRLTAGRTIPCQPGIYVVKVGSRSIKVAVK